MVVNQVRVRILLEIDKQLKSFYWFECKNEDIYWGYSGKVSQVWNSPINGTTTTIDMLKPFDLINSTKASYHESGQFHIKDQIENGQSKYHTMMDWRKKQEITSPFRVMALYTKKPIHYDNYNRLPNKKGNIPLIIPIDKTRNVRHYVEFFISPEGEFPCPLPLIATSVKIQDQPLVTQSLNNKYILVIRMIPLADENSFNNWYPDKEFSFYTDDNTELKGKND